MAYRAAAVILNYKTPELVVDCLESLVGQVDPARDRIVVVDNASPDDSAARVQAAIQDRGWTTMVQLVCAEENRGFSAGNNLGMRSVDAGAYLLLNSDTIVRPGAWDELMNACETKPDAGLIAPRLEYPDHTPQISAFRWHSPVSELIRSAAVSPITRALSRFRVPLEAYDAPREVNWASFAAILIRREAFDAVGGMDEGYFMYFEDADFCRRAAAKGFPTWYWPDARIVHLRGGSSPVKERSRARERRPSYYYASRSRYFAKFYGTPGLWAANVLWLLGRSISFAIEALRIRPTHICEGEARDIWRNAWHPTAAASEREA